LTEKFNNSKNKNFSKPFLIFFFSLHKNLFLQNRFINYTTTFP
jgi:hypothetical protein